MRPAVLFLLFACISSAQVQSAADVAAGTSSSILAQGSLAVINYYQNTNTGVSSATVSLLPANSATPVSAQVTGVTSSTITFVVPAGIATGNAEVIYKAGSQATQWTLVSIVPANLSLFRSGPTGPLKAQNINGNGTPVLNGLTTPAQPGQALVLWGTGLGATPQSAVQITLGGVSQTVLYAGAAPGQPGLNQINFRIAPGTPDGCYVPLTVTYGAQTVTSFLSKTSDGLPCHHPFQLSLAAMQALDRGDGIQTATVNLSTGIQAPLSDRSSRQESAQVLPLYLNASALAGYFIPIANAPAQPCGIAGSSGIAASFIAPSFDITTLGAITLQSGTSTFAIPWTNAQPADSPLNDLPPPGISAGNWTLHTSGGSNLAASSFDFGLPGPVQITGGVPLTLNRSQNRTITWNGSGYDSTALLRISLAGADLASPLLTCSVPAQTGSVTLPSNLLTQFTAGAAGTLTISVTETGSGIPHSEFKLLNGSPLLMIVSWASTDARPVDFQ